MRLVRTSTNSFDREKIVLFGVVFIVVVEVRGGVGIFVNFGSGSSTDGIVVVVVVVVVVVASVAVIVVCGGRDVSMCEESIVLMMRCSSVLSS